MPIEARKRSRINSERTPPEAPGAAARRRTREMTALIDWALGDVVVEPAVDETRRRAARRMRGLDCHDMRGEVT